jgi:hypothetical protein
MSHILWDRFPSTEGVQIINRGALINDDTCWLVDEAG